MNGGTVRVYIIDDQSKNIVYSWDAEKINEVRIFVYMKDQVIENVNKIEVIRERKVDTEGDIEED